MKKLNKNYVYSLEDLTSEEFKVLNEYLTNNKEAKWKSMTFNDLKNESLYWSKDLGWCLGNVTKTTNAKELFYTLENIQVDCRGLSAKQIKEMCKVFESNGYKIWGDDCALDVSDNFIYLRIGMRNEFYVNGEAYNKTTITYDKFMELFSNQVANIGENIKGFIEVTTHGINKYYVNINHIVSFGEKWIVLSGSEYPSIIDETYEEIKQLIKEAQ